MGMEELDIGPAEWRKVEHDMSPERDLPRTKCRFRYLVCSTPRSGSWLLCTGLASTGRAGRPAEFFSPLYVKAYLARIGSRDESLKRFDYMQFLMAHRSSPNGVFGMKAHFSHLDFVIPKKELQKEFLRRHDCLIFLTRRDKLAQAVSFYKARATSIYRVEAGESEGTGPPPDYSFRDIAERLSMIAAQEDDWRTLLSPFREKTIAVEYEDLAADYVGTVERVLVALGLADAAATLAPQPQVVAQRDRTNEEWEQRFMREVHGEIAGRDRNSPTPDGTIARTPSR
jgi:LPS sulfotransferase NodH